MTNQWNDPIGTHVPALAEFDAGMRAFMTAAGVHGGALAVVRDGRLVLARGYTFAKPGYAPVQPTSLFRIASTTKVLTSLAIHQLIDRGQLKLSDRVQDILELRKPDGGPLPNSKLAANPATAGSFHFHEVTIGHLLAHTGGWDRDLVAEPTHLRDAEVAAAFKQSLPVTKLQIARWGAAQPMQFFPGTKVWEYSNFGYLLLGLVVERRSGQSYVDTVKKGLLSPLGVTRTRQSLPLAEQRAPGEVLYHRVPPHNLASMLHADRRQVPEQYGGENNGNFDAFGGLLMSAPEYARVLAAVLKTEPPIPKDPLAMAVWGSPAQRPGGVKSYEHGGMLPGTWSWVTARSDGTCVVVFFNTSSDATSFTYKGKPYGIGDHPRMWHEIAESIPASAWPKHDLFAAMLGPDSPGGALYEGVWGPSSAPQFVSWDKSPEQHQALYDQQWKKGLKLRQQHAYVAGGKLVYDGIWDPNTGGQFVSWGKSRDQHNAAYGEQWGKGFKLIHQQAYVHQGQLLYDGIWQPNAGGQFVSWGKSMAQHKALYDEQWAKGFKLIHQQAYVHQGQLVYDGIWNPNPGGQFVSWGKTLAQHNALYDEWWGKGFRLIHQQAYFHEGQLLRDGIWQPDTRPQYVSWGKTRPLIHGEYAAMWPQNMRLVCLDAYAPPHPTSRR